jgi:hypothetical protein
MLKDISFITAHFFDFDWTEHLIRRIQETTPREEIRELLVINQDRTETSRRRLESLAPGLITVLEYPRSEEHFKWTRHDHAAVLNATLPRAQGTYIALFDSDAHPIRSDWRDICGKLLVDHDAIMTRTRNGEEFSHPCFMIFRQKHARMNLAFDEGLFTPACSDTGQLIGAQLKRAGEHLYFAETQRAFGGRHGHIILDSIYHHSHGSFAGVKDVLLQNQVRWQNAFFKDIVLNKGRYEMSRSEQAAFQVRVLQDQWIQRPIRKVQQVLQKTPSGA